MLKVEFHTHTYFSPDSLASPQAILDTCRHKGIDRVVITDHNCVRGARIARQIDSERTIVGEEIMTTAGELLAVFVQEEIPPYLSPMETIQRLRSQDAFISVSHPFDVIRKGHWELSELVAILPYVDAIETFNARCFWPRHNTLAQDFAHTHHMLATVGSDAHSTLELGAASLLLPEFHDTPSLKLALGKARAHTHYLPAWVHVLSRYATWRNRHSERLAS